MTTFTIRISAAALGLALLGQPLFAEDFTFKRVKPPSAGATQRINIQIEPRQAPRPSQPRSPDDAEPRTAPSVPSDDGQAQTWFWSAVSPKIGAQPGRFSTAARIAARPPRGSGVAVPSLRHLQNIAKNHGDHILRHSVGTRVSPALVLALISVESAGRADAVSQKGARGLMQLIPDTAKRFGIRDAADPEQNIRGGVAYLDWLMSEFDGDPVLALAGYNAGEGAVRRHKGVPPYSETRAYVPKVLAAWHVARQMCTSPPVMPGDGCIFDARLLGG